MANRIALFGRLLLVVAATLISGDAFASKRVALVIGNSAYQHVAKLPNPARDANAIAALLRSAGFDQVEQRNDLTIREFRRAMREFAYLARDADMALVFYAGHGIEVGGNNYLIPTDARLKSDLDIEDEVMSLDRVLRSLEAARTRLVILDACRDNPFLVTMARLTATRSIGRGLARVEPNASDMLIAFAAKAGSVAADGSTGHSPFTTALVKHVAEPGLDVRLALGRVRDDVLLNTHGRQEPFVYGSLGGKTVAITPSAPAPGSQPTVSAPADPATVVRNDYEFAERIGTRDAWELFVARHPTGFYSNLARAQIAKLSGAAQEPATKEPSVDPASPAPSAPVVVAAAGPAAGSESAGPSATDTGARPQPDLVVISPAPPPVPSPRPESPAAEPAKSVEQQIAALTVPATGAQTPSDGNQKSAVFAAIRSLQLELKRVGCDPGDIGIWTDGSKRALESFNKYAGTNLMVNVASIEALETVKARKERICPLVCKTGYFAKGDSCVRGRKRSS